MSLVTLSAVSILIGIFHIGKFCFWVPFFKKLLLRNHVADFVEIYNVCARKAIIEAAKRIINSDKVCHSYSDLNFGVTFWNTVYIGYICKKTTFIKTVIGDLVAHLKRQIFTVWSIVMYRFITTVLVSFYFRINSLPCVTTTTTHIRVRDIRQLHASLLTRRFNYCNQRRPVHPVFQFRAVSSRQVHTIFSGGARSARHWIVPASGPTNRRTPSKLSRWPGPARISPGNPRRGN